MVLRCKGKHSCSVKSGNNYGDSCEGRHKYLEVNYTCEIDLGKVEERTGPGRTLSDDFGRYAKRREILMAQD